MKRTVTAPREQLGFEFPVLDQKVGNCGGLAAIHSESLGVIKPP